MKNKPWFSTPGKPGDRTLEQQLLGLDPLFAEVAGKTVLDIGCAEGLISIECAKRGADRVWGIDVRADALHRAYNLSVEAKLDRITFEIGDANQYDVGPASYGIVLMLAVLHKLRDPTAACQRLAAAAKDLVVIRMPPEHAPFIMDARSGNTLHDIELAMIESGFTRERVTRGPFDEWVGYYRRVK